MLTPSADNSWFIAQLRPQGLSRAVSHLDRQGFATFAPHLRVTRIRKGVHREVSEPLFPGYLFVSFDPTQTGWSAINGTRGVARLILPDPRKPRALPQALMSGLIARCDEDGLLLPPETLEVGNRVRILSGPFADLVTRIETIPDGERIGVLIDLMGRKVRTSLPRSQIDKIC